MVTKCSRCSLIASENNMFTQKIRGYVILLAFRDYLRKDLKVIDIGCGNGIITKLIKNKFNCDIIGTDILDYAKGIKYKKITNPDRLPFKDNSFECALLIDTLHHTKNQKKLIMNTLRVSKEVLIYETAPGFWAWFTDVILNYITNKEMDRTFTHRTIKGWSNFFDELNLNYERIKFKLPLWYPMPQFAFRIWK